jgi:tRNA (guanine-N(7)-)-methyltransferase subunit TRM82
MPKKPSAIALATGQDTILSADKFGDVYALPLFGTPEMGEDASNDGLNNETNQKPFVPSANHLTVHTKKNQQALKNQQKAAIIAVEKKSLRFEHQLLLGHVSMLTDMAHVTLKKDGFGSSKTRSYILTADRDEHIRVSRGLPQTHITEGYCLGHSQFISKICVPRWKPECLISGGGDDYLLVWDWLSGAVRQQVELRTIVEDFKKRMAFPGTTGTDMEKPLTNSRGGIAVSGIWALECSPEPPQGPRGKLIVTFEG